MKKQSSAAGAKGGSKFSTSLVVGLLLVPLSAVAAVALVNPDAEAAPQEPVAAEVVVATTTSTTLGDEIFVPEIASDDDLWEACGEQGLILVSKEAEGSISPLEQAALDSLRAICSSEGLELPGLPVPDAVVKTVTVVASPPPSTSGDSDDGSNDTDAAEFEAAYAATVAHINTAIADGAGGEEIAAAELYLAEAATFADAGDYDSGMDKLEDARDAADDAARGRHHDDDDEYDDDEYDEDDEDHDDEDDDEEDDDEDDEDDDDEDDDKDDD